MEFPSFHHSQQQQQQSGRLDSGLGLSTNDYQQLMSGMIGSVVPNKSSVMNFRDKPDALLAIDNTNAIFGAPSRSRESGSLPDASFVNPFSVDDFAEPVRLGGTVPLKIPSSASTSSSSLSAAPSRWKNHIPDTYSAPIDDSIFGDLQPIPISSSNNNKSKKRKQQQQPRSSPSSLSRSTSIHDAPTTGGSSLLHQACMLYPKTLAVISSALGVDRGNIRKRVPTLPNAQTVRPRIPLSSSGGSDNKRRKTTKQELYSLPLFIALENKASLEVLTALAKAGPDVICLTDGPNGANAIATALYLEYSLAEIKMLLQINPAAAKGLDRHNNTLLHICCEKGASLEVVDLLLGKSPKAISSRNFCGQTPLDIAQRNTRTCPLPVIDFLQQLVLDSLEEGASHLVTGDDDDDDLFLL